MQEETDIRFNFKTNSPSIIKVIGVGGGGGNAVNLLDGLLHLSGTVGTVYFDRIGLFHGVPLSSY